METEPDALYAHTPRGTSGWQLLGDHLRCVGDLTAGFADVFGAAEVGRLVGLLHDVGKASEEFQRYLRDCHKATTEGRPEPRSRTEHKLAGALRALSLGRPEELLAIPVLGHHGGMMSPSEVGSRASDPEASERASRASERAFVLLPELGAPKIPANMAPGASSFDVFLRMLFSCVVDADYLNTERHWEPDKASLRSASSSMSDLWARFQSNQDELQAKADSTYLNCLRREIYEACTAAASGPQGVFRLTVPTGGGKTRSGMAFALKHAEIRELRRVIVAIPYTSIIDQNAREYRDILGSANLLEHHSAINLPDGDECSEERLRMELAAENWDAPVIVTTTVQLFESLFSNKPSKCRRLHNLAKSVIILDEVQTLPVGMVQPIISVLKELVQNYGVTLVLSTATQPAFSGESPYLLGFPEVTEIIPDPDRYFDALKRVEYQIERDPWSWEQVASRMGEQEQVLCVVNSRKDALTLFQLLDGSDALHLSTLMCPAHRRDVLDEIKKRLQVGSSCRVASTQLVEAGVDLDFPFLMRAMGPLDRIVQAGGRCNREGRMTSPGQVLVFTPADGGAPRGSYATAMAEAVRILSEPDCDLHDPSVFDRYFRCLWQDCSLDSEGIEALRPRLDYPEVASKFRMIDDDTVAVVVPYGEPGPRKILDSIPYRKGLTRQEWRELQQYTVSLRQHDFQRCVKDGSVKQLADGLYEWTGSYSEHYGLSMDLIDPADLIA